MGKEKMYSQEKRLLALLLNIAVSKGDPFDRKVKGVTFGEYVGIEGYFTSQRHKKPRGCAAVGGVSRAFRETTQRDLDAPFARQTACTSRTAIRSFLLADAPGAFLQRACWPEPSLPPPV